jgi:Uncharacterised MFS-type transporter YbfB
MMTVAFGIGQTLGPIVVGAVTDKLGNLSYALNVSAATLVLGAIACMCQRPIAVSEQTARVQSGMRAYAIRSSRHPISPNLD